MRKNKISIVICLSLLGLFSQCVSAETVSVAKSQVDLILRPDEDGDNGIIMDPGGSKNSIMLPNLDDNGKDGIFNPNQKTPLRISGMSSFDFGEGTVSGNTKYYNAKTPEVTLLNSEKEKAERPNFIQIIDNRGTNSGWSLTAKLVDQFSNKDAELKGSEIHLKNGYILPENQNLLPYSPLVVSEKISLAHGMSQEIARAEKGNGMGTWNILFGSLDESTYLINGNARESVNLEIPGHTKKTIGCYTATIQWTLTDTPKK